MYFFLFSKVSALVAQLDICYITSHQQRDVEKQIAECLKDTDISLIKVKLILEIMMRDSSEKAASK